MFEASLGRYPDLAFIDLETTGFSPVNDAIIELAVVLVDGESLEPTAEYETLLHAHKSNGAVRVNKITDEMLLFAPKFEDVAPSLRSLFHGRQVVGHNIKRFDLPFINNAFQRAGHVPVHESAVIDTLHMAKRYVPSPDSKLTTLAAWYRLTYPDAHTALADTVMTAKVFKAIAREGHRIPYGTTVVNHTDLRAPSGWRNRANAHRF